MSELLGQALTRVSYSIISQELNTLEFMLPFFERSGHLPPVFFFFFFNYHAPGFVFPPLPYLWHFSPRTRSSLIYLFNLPEHTRRARHTNAPASGVQQREEDGFGAESLSTTPMPTQTIWVALRRAVDFCRRSLWPTTHAYLELVYLVTAFVPSDTACLASSPGSSRRTAVWISRLVMVERLL